MNQVLEKAQEKLIEAFAAEITENKFAQDYVANFEKLQEFLPRGQKLIIKQILNREWLDKYFDKWSKVLEDPLRLQKML